VIGANRKELHIEKGDPIECDGALWATEPSPPNVLRESGLTLDTRGFLLVRETLQTQSDPAVFGTGDCVAFPAYPDLPRNGVMAVREGRVLFENVSRHLKAKQLRAFRPQKRWLSLLNTNNGTAVASYGPLSLSGRWARRLKDRIDRRWMGMFATHSAFPDSPNTSMRLEDVVRKCPAMFLPKS